MKVLFVQKVKGYAGSENWMTNIIPALNKRGINCHLLCVIPPNDVIKLDKFKADLAERNIEHTFIISNDNLSYSLLKKLKMVATADQYDLIHLNLIHAELWFSVLRTFYGLKTRLVSTIHGFDEKFQAAHGFDPQKIKSNTYIRILKFCQRRIHRYYAVSEGLRRLVTESKVIPDDKIRVINYGFDYPPVTSEPLPQSKNVKTIFVPGRVVPYKGQEMVINAIDLLIEKGLKFEIIFAGELQGTYGDYLKDKLLKLGHTDKVKFIGHVPNIEDYFLMADIVVLPSKSEGFGLVLLEAFNYEAPVITFDVPAFNETITHNETGIITPCFDIQVLSENIVKVLSDSSLASRLTKNAKQRLLDYYCLDRMVEDTVQFYNDSLR